jgi:hypothetical protein
MSGVKKDEEGKQLVRILRNAPFLVCAGREAKLGRRVTRT